MKKIFLAFVATCAMFLTLSAHANDTMFRVNAKVLQGDTVIHSLTLVLREGVRGFAVVRQPNVIGAPQAAGINFEAKAVAQPDGQVEVQFGVTLLTRDANNQSIQNTQTISMQIRLLPGENANAKLPDSVGSTMTNVTLQVEKLSAAEVASLVTKTGQ